MESSGFGPSLRVAPTNFSITAGRAKVMAETETGASNNNCQLANGTFCA